MSFAAPRKKSTAPSTQRGNSGSKTDLMLPSNKSFDQTKKFDGFGINTIHLSSQISQENFSNETPNNNFVQQQMQMPLGSSQNFHPFEQVLTNKIQRLLERMGFLEDAVSRVELQQDSMRPVLKMLENSYQQQVANNSNRINLNNNRQQNGSQTSRKHLKENTNSFISSNNGNNGGGGGGCYLLDKLTKNSQQLNHNQSTSQLNNSDASLLLQQQPAYPDFTKEDIEKIIGFKYEKVKMEINELSKTHIDLQKSVEFNNENLNNQMECMRQEILTCQDQMQQMITLYQTKLQEEIQSKPNENSISPLKIVPPLSTSPLQSSKDISKLEQSIKELTQKISEHNQDIKNQFNCLKAKVDSMDNTYDKRISNLEAVITPLLAQQMNQKTFQEQIQQELSQLILRQATSLIEEKLNAYRIQESEQQIILTKQKEPYLSNQSSSSSSHKKKSLAHQKLNSNNQLFNTSNSCLNQVNTISQNNSSSTPNIEKNSGNKTHSSLQISSNSSNNNNVVTQNTNIAQEKQSQQKTQQQLSQQQQVFKKISGGNNDIKNMLEDLEQFILNSSETINEKLEDLQRQMGDLHSEIMANIELVKEKKKINSADTGNFIKVLGDDVKQFISCMREELDSVVGAISERDDKCKIDMEKIQSKIQGNDSLKQQIQSQSSSANSVNCQSSTHNSISSKSSINTQQLQESSAGELSGQERKELQKIEAFKEHSQALQRHMENTSQYLQKEVPKIEQLIDEAKQLVLKELEIDLYSDDDYFNQVKKENEKQLVEKEIREVEEEDQEDEEDGEEDEEDKEEQKYYQVDEQEIEEEEDDEEEEEEEAEDYGNVDEGGNEDEFNCLQMTNQIHQIEELDPEEEDSCVLQTSIQKRLNKSSQDTSKKKILTASLLQQQQLQNDKELVASHQTSISSDNTATLSAKQGLNYKNSQGQSNNSNIQQNHSTQPFYYQNQKQSNSKVQKNRKSKQNQGLNKQQQQIYNVEVYSSSADSNNENSGTSSYGSINQAEKYHNHQIFQEKKAQEKSRSISTINDESEPHRAQKSPQQIAKNKNLQNYTSHK